MPSVQGHVDIGKELKEEIAMLKYGTSSLLHIKYMRGVHGSGFLIFEPGIVRNDIRHYEFGRCSGSF